jgi:hypothetical protein
VRALWRTVEGTVQKLLLNISLADLTRRERAMVQWLGSPTPAAGPATPEAEAPPQR